MSRLDRHWRKLGCTRYREAIRDKIVELMPLEKRMLDVRCGSSVLYDHLPPELRVGYTGVDFTPEFIGLCKERHPEADWGVEDARDLSFSDGSFYLVNSTTVLQHILDWEKAARELVRVSSRYVVSTCRSGLGETRILSTKPVLRRRFNPEDILRVYGEYGEATVQWVEGAKPGRLVGMYVLEKWI